MKNVLNRETFDFVLTNELKRALRSQNFLTLVLLEPRGGKPAGAVDAIVGLVSAELRETDMLAVEGATVSMVLLDADIPSASRVVERVLSRLEHYQFSMPVEIEVGTACCPTHGADLETLRRVAAEARTGMSRREPRDNAHVE